MDPLVLCDQVQILVFYLIMDLLIIDADANFSCSVVHLTRLAFVILFVYVPETYGI